MGLSRKKQKTKPPAVEEPTSEAVAESSTKTAEAQRGNDGAVEPVVIPGTVTQGVSTPLDTVLPDSASVEGVSPAGASTAAHQTKLQVKSKKSWYGGTWPRKSCASTQIARESILADNSRIGSTTSDLNRFESASRKSSAPSLGRPPSMYMGKSRQTSDITMAGCDEAQKINDKEPAAGSTSKSGSGSPKAKTEDAVEESKAAAPVKPDEDSKADTSIPKAELVSRPTISSGWLGGWLGGASIPTKTTKPEEATKPTMVEPPKAVDPYTAGTTIVCEEPPKDAPQVSPAPPSSWFGLWSSALATTAKPTEETEQLLPVKAAEPEANIVMEDAPYVEPTTATPKKPASGSSWAFWSLVDTPKIQTVVQKDSAPVKDQGEEDMRGESSETRPESAKAVALKDDGKSTKAKGKGSRPVSVEESDLAKKATQLEAPLTKVIPSQNPSPAKTGPPNLLIPSVKGTYRLVENPSILEQITQLLLRGQQKPSKHVFLAKETPKIRKALAIGIHGLFPAPLLRTVIGQPTGTSIRFANHAADAIRRWGDQHGCADCEIEKVALEGEGKIAERVDNLWKLLLNWIEHVRKADFVIFACHSQGVPVAVMLIAKLIEFGVVSTGRIGVCAMAGVSLGPFADYKSRLFSGSAGELFEFADPKSPVSQRYEHALRIALNYGTRITFCGSIDDQLVSLESSTFSTASHPHIYRAVFVDGRIHAPNFLSHLIGFALKLRNLGVSDHGLIRELSAPLAGSLYTGEGHSRLYDDVKVYDLAIEYALETTSAGDIPLDMASYSIPTNANPYILPWIMRGLLEEDFVKTEVNTEVSELLKQFDDWKPSTKVLKDVKYRLEAVRSKL
ncbi:hypothetical protein BJ878DRAFT_511369 [Calycina marina]|uniref:YMC020W-like alpha/beta hydrolase domain-containing protein n=1 Tax=Calycina marina TaxID=1763456 RepID=A0A9P7Z0V8_9HELO|nr:hypothetical protein BJ878DRAFT_511369 [Calycina marina]